MAELSALRIRLRRTYLRYRRVLTAGLAGVAVVSLTQVLAPGSPPTTPVVVAARDLSGGRLIGPDDVHLVEMGPGLAPAYAVTSVSRVVGQVVAAPMREGEALTDRRLLGASLVAGYPSDTVAAPVRIQDSQVVSLLHVGDRIDVYSSNGDQASPAERVVSDAPVMTLPGIDAGGREGALVVLAVTQTDAARLAQAGATTALSVSIRS